MTASSPPPPGSRRTEPTLGPAPTPKAASPTPPTAGTPPPPKPNAPKPRPTAAGWVLRAIAWALGLLVAGVVAGIAVLGLALALAYPNLPEVASMVDYHPKLPLRVYTADGKMAGEFGEERRLFTPIAEIPKVMKDAVLAIEDANFYKHSGVDFKGMLRATLAQFSEAKSQGASTITMQLARNFYLSSEKTFTRKIYEVLLSYKIESALTKDQILEVYMNQIFLGHRAYGFAAASEVYFGKPLKQVSVAEAAMLAGLPKAPSAYNPLSNPKRATVRQQYIIERMLENGFITKEQRDEAVAQRLQYRTVEALPVHAEYAAEAARQLVFAQYGEEAYTRGLNVVLTIRSDEQTAAFHALRKGLIEFDRRQPYRGPEAYVDLPAEGTQVDARVAEALADHADQDDFQAAVVLAASAKQIDAMLQSGEAVTITGDGLRAVSAGLSSRAPAKLQVRRGAVIRVVQDARGKWASAQTPEVEGAFVSVDPRTGAIRAMVGGFDYAKSKFNHATQAWRQPGSTFKPFIYSAALEKGVTANTVVADSPLFFSAGETGSQPWEPKNYEDRYDGPIPMHTGLAKSKNMVSIRVVRKITPQFAGEWVTRFGFDPARNPPYFTLALGAGAVTPLQMATGISVFANGGYLLPPVLIARITDSFGRVISEPMAPPLDESRRVIDARNAFVMNTLLQEVTKVGTAASAQKTLKRPDLYGKTGTTNESMDAWFAGYQPTVAAAVWIGYDTPHKLGARETGGGLALPLWIEYMQQVLKGVPVTEMQPPEGVTKVNGQWVFDEFLGGQGVSTIDVTYRRPVDAPTAPSEDERSGILDLFR